ncbi:MAG: peptidoglycan editing factor PgeF [Halobacteria archaeon]|nr:peptidoglycan editing factor PgeF [Halobacteria archaeon]
MTAVLNRKLWLPADWPAPANVHAGTSWRHGGTSQGAYASLNLAMHVGDATHAVIENRRRLGLPTEPIWLNQVHGLTVVNADRVAEENSGQVIEADAAYTEQAGVICAVLTADCLPVLLCDRAGSRVAAVHAGWRGLAAGIIDRAVTALQLPGGQLLAWLGPAIGPHAYEVGEDVRGAFLSIDADAHTAFRPNRPGHWWMDIYQLARQQLAQRGVTEVYGGDRCTWQEANSFYSYRRDGVTGRMASVIWFESNGA